MLISNATKFEKLQRQGCAAWCRESPGCRIGSHTPNVPLVL